MNPTLDGVTPNDTSIAARLEAARHELLDLGLRNPLLNLRLSKLHGVSVVREEVAAVYDALVRQGKTMYFQAAPEPPKRAAPTTSETILVSDDDNPAFPPEAPAGLTLFPLDPLPPTQAERQTLLTDNKLQTAESVARLQSRLLNTFYTARTSLEETGVNILYLALGMLTWYETDTSEEARQAPLVLVPVQLERGTAAERFKLRYTGAEVEGNLSLQARLKADFGVSLPLPELDEEGRLAEYYAAVTAAVGGFSRWTVIIDQVALSFFSFAKLAMYVDLDISKWPAGISLVNHPAIGALLGAETGFRDQPPTVGDTAFLDTDSPAADLHQVLDADSSQLLALLAVHEGRNLVIQGPPGTGKSQTIANLLAEAIGAGKKVLFVAEKMAALEVVKRRLDALGLGAACLELHSHKTSKKALHDELRQTLGLGRPAALPAVGDQMAQLPRYRAALNAYALAVNTSLGRSRRTAQQIAGELLRVRQERGDVELPRIAFARLADWTDADAAHAETLAGRLEATLQRVGLPRQLLFWGSRLTVLLPADQDILAVRLRTTHAAIVNLQTTAAALAHLLDLPVPTDRAAAEALLPAARHAHLAPPLAGTAAADDAWNKQAAHVGAAVQAGSECAALRQRYDAALLPEAWDQQLSAERTAMLTYGGKWWNFLSGTYRQARKRLQGAWRGPLPTDPAAVVAAIDAIHEFARHRQTLAEADVLLRRLFGVTWQSGGADWAALRRISDYLLLTHQRIAQGHLPAALLAGLATRRPEEMVMPVSALEAALTEHRAAVQAAADALQLDETRRFGGEGRLQFQDFVTQLALVLAWAADLPALQLTTEWNNVATAVRDDEHLPELVTLAEIWPAATHHLAAAVRQTWLEYLQRLAYEKYPALRQFERAGHEDIAARFRQADLASLQHNRVRAMRYHFEQLPNQQAGGQMLFLKNEFAKKARHKPVRVMMQEAGRAVQAIKPVFMMSPLSVANFLPPGAVEFDLVVFDEASQVKPVDALGAIARGRQLVVVGDSKQLPPTSFFDSLTGAKDADDEENVTADIQSILELCKARQMPERMLRWHYRSLHQSLIAASNHLFYQNKLVIFPSPGGHGQLGLVYHHLPDTHYERGTTRTNPLEAQAVAAAVLHHARTTPKLTLGVVAFSTAQRQAIQDALEIGRKQYPDTEAFFGRHPHEPFFVKNLENVQGDERDVILISIGYGRTADGYLSMSFGPLSGQGGERRLNVLITRAKQRCEVFTNLKADDLDLSRGKGVGVAALKTFLSFAQTGRLNANEETGREMESPFEEAVHRALTARGYLVRPQIGSQGFYIDLAVVDPDQPGRYVLGIECDGAMYHSARSARDRDRLRQQVLEAVGWRLHRIWSTDWFRDPARETERAVAAIEEARRLAVLDQPDEVEDVTVVSADTETVAGFEREQASAVPATTAQAYQVAQVPDAVRQGEFHEHPVGWLAAWATEVVRVEGPVHFDEVARRLAQAAGLKQVGSRIRAAVEAGVAQAARTGAFRRQGVFLWPVDMAETPLRDRTNAPDTARKLPMVAPEELAAAVQAAVRDSFGIDRAAVASPALRLLGFVRVTEEARGIVEATVIQLLITDQLREVNGVLQS